MTEAKKLCPDGGTCHHQFCNHPTRPQGCFRMQHCGPLSGVFPNDEWPDLAAIFAHGRLCASGRERMQKFVITDPRGDPYLTRYYVEEWGDGSAIYLHYIHRSDADREFHDHPFHFRSLIVSGSYIEHTPDAPPATFKAGDWNVSRAEKLHRLEVVEGPVVTILYRTHKVREWGFRAAAPGSEWIHHETYLDAKFGKGNWSKGE